MSDIDKEKIGQFIAACRKAKKFTQKDLANHLYVSDKAVSKWERGLSLPDICLLQPLAACLDVSVSELLNGEKIQTEISKDAMDKIVVQTLQLTGEVKAQKQKQLPRIYGLLVGIALLEIFLVHWSGVTWMDFAYYQVFTVLILALVFGLYFFVLMKRQLPYYYDENKIDFVSSGMFRMSMPKLHFNNANWSYILQAGQIWSACTLLFYPILFSVGFHVLHEHLFLMMMICFIIDIVALFVGIYRVGMEHE